MSVIRKVMPWHLILTIIAGLVVIAASIVKWRDESAEKARAAREAAEAKVEQKAKEDADKVWKKDSIDVALEMQVLRAALRAKDHALQSAATPLTSLGKETQLADKVDPKIAIRIEEVANAYPKAAAEVIRRKAEIAKAEKVAIELAANLNSGVRPKVIDELNEIGRTLPKAVAAILSPVDVHATNSVPPVLVFSADQVRPLFREGRGNLQFYYLIFPEKVHLLVALQLGYVPSTLDYNMAGLPESASLETSPAVLPIIYAVTTTDQGAPISEIRIWHDPTTFEPILRASPRIIDATKTFKGKALAGAAIVELLRDTQKYLLESGVRGP